MILETSMIYIDEANVLNMAVIGTTAKKWRMANPEQKGNIRDYAAINKLVCLANLENLNALFISDNMPQKEGFIRLNEITIHQMQILIEVETRKFLKYLKIQSTPPQWPFAFCRP